jgi:hypothetical protein
MKILRIALLAFVALGLSACDDKAAREYAEKMIPVLDSYQEQLSQKIKAEQDSYEELAKSYDKARKAEISIRLADERVTRSEDLGEELAKADSGPSLSKVLNSLQDYAAVDFKTTQEILQEGMDARGKYLQGLESLEVDLQNVKLLKASLKELSKGKSDFKQFKEATDFLLKTDTGINQLLCVDLKKELDKLNTEKANTKDPEKQQHLDEQIKQLQERMATKKCP